jgi:hypothetical protein
MTAPRVLRGCILESYEKIVSQLIYNVLSHSPVLQSHDNFTLKTAN